MLRINRFLTTVVGVGIFAVSVAGCASDPQAETRELGEMMAYASASSDYLGMPESVAEAMPKASDSLEPSEPLSQKHADLVGAAHLVVIGEVTEVVADSAFAFTEDGAVAEVPFGSQEALWAYVSVTISIDRVVAARDADFSAREVNVLMLAPLSKDLDFADRAYRGLGKAVFFLIPDGTSTDAPYRPLGSLGDWIFTLDANGVPNGAPLATESQRDALVLAAVQKELGER